VFTPKIQKGIDKKKIKLMQGDDKLKALQEKKPVKIVNKIKKIDSEGWKDVLQ